MHFLQICYASQMLFKKPLLIKGCVFLVISVTFIFNNNTFIVTTFPTTALNCLTSGLGKFYNMLFSSNLFSCKHAKVSLFNSVFLTLINQSICY